MATVPQGPVWATGYFLSPSEPSSFSLPTRLTGGDLSGVLLWSGWGRAGVFLGADWLLGLLGGGVWLDGLHGGAGLVGCSCWVVVSLGGLAGGLAEVLLGCSSGCFRKAERATRVARAISSTDMEPWSHYWVFRAVEHSHHHSSSQNTTQPCRLTRKGMPKPWPSFKQQRARLD